MQNLFGNQTFGGMAQLTLSSHALLGQAVSYLFTDRGDFQAWQLDKLVRSADGKTLHISTTTGFELGTGLTPPKPRTKSAGARSSGTSSSSFRNRRRRRRRRRRRKRSWLRCRWPIRCRATGTSSSGGAGCQRRGRRPWRGTWTWGPRYYSTAVCIGAVLIHSLCGSAG